MAGPVKIGCSAAPDRRRYTLETWSPFALEIVATIDGDAKLERRFHCKFADSWERREWFTWTPALQAAIDAINAGTFDVATLPEPRRIDRTRATRDVSYITPAFRYRSSVWSRLRAVAEHPHGYRALKDIFGTCPWRTPAEVFLANKDKIESVIATFREQRKAA